MERVAIAIVGAGPAGVSAALNAAARHKSCLLFGAGQLSDKVARSEQIANYPGTPALPGAALNERFAQQLKAAGVAVTEKRITGVYNMGDYYALLAGQEEFDADCVILTTGVEAVRPVPGEQELLGRGVSYCATCDGNLYKGKTIAVVCDSAPLEEEAVYLAQLAQKVYYLPLFQGSQLAAANVQRLASPLAQVLGERRVSGIALRNGLELPVDGVFFLKQSVSPAVLLPGLAVEGGHVVVDRQMRTNQPGCFAAGDCTGLPYQIAKAVGEGNIAAHAAFAYLAEKQKG